MPLLPDKELTFMVGIGHRQILAAKFEKDVFLRVYLPIPFGSNFYTGIDQESAEDVNHPFKLFDNRQAGSNENATRNNRADDTPEKYPVPVFRRHSECCKYQYEYKQVIHAK